MKKIRNYIILGSLILILTGCGSTKNELTTENLKKLELTGNLITYQAYYHNVIEYDKSKDSGILHILDINRQAFIEYNGTIKMGINLSKVKINIDGNKVKVFIPKATVFGEPDIDDEDFNEKKFIADREQFFNTNKLNSNDSANALIEGQKNLKNIASNDKDLLSKAQKRAKVLIEEKITQLYNLKNKNFNIDWEFEEQ